MSNPGSSQASSRQRPQPRGGPPAPSDPASRSYHSQPRSTGMRPCGQFRRVDLGQIDMMGMLKCSRDRMLRPMPRDHSMRSALWSHSLRSPLEWAVQLLYGRRRRSLARTRSRPMGRPHTAHAHTDRTPASLASGLPAMPAMISHERHAPCVDGGTESQAAARVLARVERPKRPRGHQLSSSPSSSPRLAK
jgi:hypothetical protein